MRPPSPSFLNINNIIVGSLTRSEKPWHDTAPLLATFINLPEQTPGFSGCGSGKSSTPSSPTHHQPSPLGATPPRCPSRESVHSQSQLSLPRPVCRVARRAACKSRRPRRANTVTCISTPFFLFVSPLGAVSVGPVPSSDGAPGRLRRDYGQ